MKTELKETQIDLYSLFHENFYKKRNICLKDFLSRVELQLILYSLNKTNGNQREAAEILGIKPTTLNEKLRKYNIIFHKSATEKIEHH